MTGPFGQPVAADVSVRPARPGDAAFVADVQLDSWRNDFAPRLPAGALDALDPVTVEAGWRAAVTNPPSHAHRLLVALLAQRVVGYVAVGPSADPDASSQDGEIYALTVATGAQRQGHGSRLLSAGVQTLRELSISYVRLWAFDGDEALHRFLSGAGWAADGATRTLEIGGEDVGQQRWHAALS